MIRWQIVTWGRLQRQRIEGVMRPCVAERDPPIITWGCQQFVESLHLYIISEDTQPEPLPADFQVDLVPYCNLPEEQAGPS